MPTLTVDVNGRITEVDGIRLSRFSPKCYGLVCCRGGDWQLSGFDYGHVTPQAAPLAHIPRSIGSSSGCLTHFSVFQIAFRIEAVCRSLV